LEVETFPGQVKKWGLTFLINTKDVEGFRAAGSRTWGGIDKHLFLDRPKRQTVTGATSLASVSVARSHLETTVAPVNLRRLLSPRLRGRHSFRRECGKPGFRDLLVMLRSVLTCANSTNNLPIDGDREAAFHLDEVARGLQPSRCRHIVRQLVWRRSRLFLGRVLESLVSNSRN
jgi:hypothetical protein